MVPVFQKMQFSTNPVIGGVPVVFTIHNLAFQGVFPATILPELGLGWEVLDIRALEYWGQISYLKGGINFSERITTVSPSYAREILTPQLGFGLDGALLQRADELSGILNAIDVSRWNPEADELIDAPASVRTTYRERGEPNGFCSKPSACRWTQRRWRGRWSV